MSPTISYRDLEIMTKIIAGNSSKKLAHGLSEYLGMEYLDAQIERFADQELRVQLAKHMHKDDAIIVQSTCKPANEHLMELLLLVDAAKRAGAREVTALIPYFGYSRQDRASYEWGPVSARLVATLLEASGVDHIITLDLHSHETEGFFKIGVQNIDPIPLFAAAVKKSANLVVVSPDVGGFMRAKRLAESLDADLATINKSRSKHNQCQMDSIIGEVTGRDCLIVDDIADTGETICKAAALLKDNGALKVDAIVTHPVLSGDAVHKLDNAPLGQIITTNSIEQGALPAKFTVVDIIPVIAGAMGCFPRA